MTLRLLTKQGVLVTEFEDPALTKAPDGLIYDGDRIFVRVQTMESGRGRTCCFEELSLVKRYDPVGGENGGE